MGRRERRYHRRRMIKKAMKVYGDKEWALHNYDNMADCSCSGCGNQRHNPWSDNKLTMQERKAKDDYKDQLKLI